MDPGILTDDVQTSSSSTNKFENSNQCVIDIYYNGTGNDDELASDGKLGTSYMDIITRPLTRKINPTSKVDDSLDETRESNLTTSVELDLNVETASNLNEELNRIEKLLENRKNSEELLLRVFPNDIASQLASGISVKPKTYECVTIYFSDIVGFTSMVSDLDPIQVHISNSNLITCNTFLNKINCRFNTFLVTKQTKFYSLKL